MKLTCWADWDGAVARTAALLTLPEDVVIPYPVAPLHPPGPAEEGEGQGSTSKAATTLAKGKAKGGKRKSKRKAAADEAATEDAEDGDGDDAAELDVDGAGDGAKKAKTDTNGQPESNRTSGGTANADGPEEAARAAAIAASFGGVLDADSLRMPIVPTREEMSQILLEVRKKALREEYGV